MWGRMEVQPHTFLTTAPNEGEWTASPSGCFTPSTHWDRRLVPTPTRNQTPIIQPSATHGGDKKVYSDNAVLDKCDDWHIKLWWLYRTQKAPCITWHTGIIVAKSLCLLSIYLLHPNSVNELKGTNESGCCPSLPQLWFCQELNKLLQLF